MIENILCIAVFFGLVPYVIGHGVNRMLKLTPSIVKNYLVGYIFIWAMFQVVTVPLVLEKQSFSIVVLIINIIASAVILWALVYELIINKAELLRIKRIKNKTLKAMDIIALLVVLGIISWLLYMVITLQHTDADDSRFIVNAVEILRTDRMFLTDVITGEELSTWVGELGKDITSPWAVYIAYCAKITGISVVRVAHTILPIFLILCGISVFWLISKVVFKKSITDRCLFLGLVLLLNIYGYHSVYTAETFFLTRIWQGKAVVASVAIPVLFYIFMKIYENERTYGYYILLALANIGMCLMSGMGIIIGAIMLGCAGLIYGIRKRNIWLTLLMWEMCVPNVIYFLINEFQPEVWTLT